MPNSDIYTHAEDCLIEDMDGESLLYHPGTTTTLHLNQPSLLVWNLCDGERSVQDVITTLQEAFPDQNEQIAEDVVDVITELREKKVLVKVTGAARS